MKRGLILAAAAVVLAANIWALLAVSRNRSGAPGGTVELTERELRLRPVPGESTALFLELEWDVLPAPSTHREAPRWLDAAKISELGFDCSVRVTDPAARDHYRSLMARPVFVALEYEGKALEQAPPDRRQQTRLFAVDAGLDPDRLRERHADTNRYIIARGLVRVWLEEEKPSVGELPSKPRLQGQVTTLFPRRIFVPRPHCHLLEGLVASDNARQDERNAEPRFAATISWGNHYEPWVKSVRLLSPSP